MINNFTNLFDPLINDEKKLPDKSGVYLICIKDKNNLPTAMKDLTYYIFNGYPVLYVGISGKQGLRKRDYRNHFKGKARNSTLRKSLGVLFNYEKTWSENEIDKKSKYRFINEHELQLSKWMKSNLLMYYYTTEDNIGVIETELINIANPPLNIDKNNNIINQRFRDELYRLRNTHI